MATLSSRDKSHSDCPMQSSGSDGGCFQSSETPTDIYNNDVIDNQHHAPDPTPAPGPFSVPAQNTAIYDGFKFFKADPIPGQKANWTRVERTQMYLSQSELYHMVQKRANKISAAKQYLTLSDTRRAHVNKLIHEQRRYEPQFEWSCVYAKERTSHRDDQGVTSMDVVLMKRPLRTRPNPRTPMGDLVDLDVPFHLDENDTLPSDFPGPAPRAFVADQVDKPGPVVQGPLPRPVSVTLPFTELELSQGKIAETLDSPHTLHEHFRSEGSNFNYDRSDWSSEASSDVDDATTILDHEQSDVSSTVEDPDTMKRDREKLSNPRSSYRQKSRSPDLHERRSFYRPNAQGPRMESMGRYLPLRPCQLDMTAAKNALSAKRAWSECAGNEDSRLWEKRYRIQRIDDEELRSRLLDCEARIERWERAFTRQTQILQNTVAETSKLKRSRTFWDFSSMRHCGCQCPRNGKTGDKE